MKHKIVWLLLLAIVSVGLFFYFSKYQGQKESTLFTFLSNEYNNKFILKTWPIGNFLVSSANSNTSCCGDGSSDSYDGKATPAVIVQDSKNQKIKSIYEVSFTTSAADGKFNKGNIIYLSDTKQIKEYFVAKWNIDWGGSAGLKGMALFGNKDGQFQPIAGYPFPADSKSTVNLTDKLSNKQYSFPITGDSNFSEVTDLNNDGKLDLLFADWKWDFDKGESHYVPRPWNLQVFELVDNTFKVAKWWNGGEIYKTPENIGYTDADTTRLRQIFYEKSK